MRLIVLAGVILVASAAVRAESSAASLAVSCDEATSDLERHDLGCPEYELDALPVSKSPEQGSLRTGETRKRFTGRLPEVSGHDR